MKYSSTSSNTESLKILFNSKSDTCKKKNKSAMYLNLIFIGGLLFLFFLFSCNDNGKGLDREIRTLIQDDSEISIDDWDILTKYIKDYKKKNKSFFINENIDYRKLKVKINQVGQKMRPPVKVSFSTDVDENNQLVTDRQSNEPISLRLYLERSGSMIPYDSPKSSGKFKSAIVSLLNHFPNGDNSQNLIFIVNDAIYPYSQNLTDFIRDKNIFASTKNIGNPQYTDFAQIFESILNDTKENQISLLVSDLIYSTKNMQNVNLLKIFEEAKGLTTAVFKSSAKNKSAIIVKLKADFDGNYYCYNNKATSYRGMRPYYFMLIGNSSTINRLLLEAEYKDFRNFKLLKDYQNAYCFIPNNYVKNPYYSILPSSDWDKGRFIPVQRGESQIKSIKIEKKDRNSDDFQFTLAVDLSNIFVEETYKSNPDNYIVESSNRVTIKDIIPITSSNIKPTNKKFMRSATHYFVMNGEIVNKNQNVTILLKNRFPQWIIESTSENDLNTSDNNFSNTTFALKYLMEGIFDFYYPSQNDAYYTTINITLN
jgi:hypothetical protein